ncbi:MAG: BLUF domain-containing protein [Magnetococcales bacterium]|nr:BLUF domain-containing protein [Magnetococcales bacterium]
MALIHAIYTSIFQEGLKPDALEAILEKSRENNEKQQITGMLIYASGLFLQLIEGEEQAVEALLTNIKEDQRHYGYAPLVKEPISQRSFSDWSMGFAEEKPEALGKILGLEGALGAQELFEKLKTTKGWPRLFLEHYAERVKKG